VTVAVDVPPPRTVVGFNATAETFGALIVNVACEDVPFTVAVIVDVA
jgi:hypothetical protein